MSNQVEQIPAEIEREMQEIAERAPSDFCHYSDIVDREEWCKEKFRHFFAAGMLAERERLMKKGDDELEKMIDDFEDWDGSYSRADFPTAYTTRDIARFFANWQRERMMKEAVEGEIVKDIFGKLGVTAKVNLDGFKFGEKVRVIIEEIK